MHNSELVNYGIKNLVFIFTLYVRPISYVTHLAEYRRLIFMNQTLQNHYQVEKRCLSKRTLLVIPPYIGHICVSSS
jgi:hypothetical protein